MRPIAPNQELGGKAIVFGEDQPEYLPLPARTDGTVVVTTWELTAVERAAILAGANIILQISTFGKPIQPLSVYVEGMSD